MQENVYNCSTLHVYLMSILYLFSSKRSVGLMGDYGKFDYEKWGQLFGSEVGQIYCIRPGFCGIQSVSVTHGNH